jgi:hypothetical protein
MTKEAADPIREIRMIYALVSDDAYAATFQTMGQYRSALLKGIVVAMAKRSERHAEEEA